MNYEHSREQDVNLLTISRPTDKDFNSTIAIVAQPDGSGHQEVPTSPVPSHDSGFTVSPSTFRDGTYVSNDVGATSSGVVLTVGTTFENWEHVDEYLEIYGREQGFVVRKKRVERDEMGMVRKRTYDCEHGGRYTPKKKAALSEQRNRTSKRIECGWHINLSFPKTSSHITVTTFVNEHNHTLNLQQTREPRPSAHASSAHSVSPRYRSVLEAAAPKNRSLPKSVLEDIEFYTLHGNLGVTTQRQLLKAKYPNHQLPARDIATAVQKFKGDTDIKQLDNDAAKLWIWELARKATQIAVDQQDHSLEELLKSYIKDKEERTRTNSQNTQQ
ncbi:19958_t:CDS:1 [Funneliformis geosporum]|uniref:14702_t:CDS:1 n=1 Tax=Funneliformis geosporum TaxID=1117311 RepID=A0A9W4T123_9GLOM|nr:19958_t:CDS:1 [Funneliformis geosporum]CAI2188305.1 14702_t:CDS:1 [Funneliformis geosporum]